MIQETPFKIDELSFRAGNSQPRTSPGILSDKQLDGIEFIFRTYSDEQKDQIDTLFARGTVTVEDPFSGRTYEATIHLDTTSYSPGMPETTYSGYVNEIDHAPHVDDIEIDGRRMSPLHYHEEARDGAVFRRALLRLSGDEIDWIRPLIKAGTTTLKRVGVDDAPLHLQFVGRPYWSVHNDDDGKTIYYKQIVNFANPAPPDVVAPDNPYSLLAKAPDQEALRIGLVYLTAQFEALVNELNRDGTLSDAAKARLLTGDIISIIGKDRAETIPWLTVHLDDAEAQFN